MLERTRESLQVAVTTNLNSTAEIILGRYATCLLHVPDGSSINSLTVHGYDPINDHYSPLYKADGTAVVLTVDEDGCYEVPIAVYASERIRLVGDAAGDIVVTLVT